MDIKNVTPGLSVAPQIAEADVAHLAAEGFKTIINVRPDGEEPGQPTSATMAALAEESGLAYRYIPITPGQITPAEVTAFAEACQDLPGPVFSYCRSGTRAIMLWALSQRGTLAPEEIAATARAAGYDLPPAVTGV